MLVILDPSTATAPLFRAARLVDAHTSLTVAVLLDETTEPRERLSARLSTLESQLAGAANVEVVFDVEQCLALARRLGVTTVIAGPWAARSPRVRVLALLELVRNGFDVLSVGSRSSADAVATGVIGVALDEAVSLPTVSALVRALPHCLKVIAFLPSGKESLGEGLTALLDGVPVETCLLDASVLGQAEALAEAADAREVDLVLLSLQGTTSLGAIAAGLLAADTLAAATRPTLIAHPRSEPQGLLEAHLASSDTLRLPGVASPVMLELTGPLGRATLPAEARIVSGGTGEPQPHVDGVVHLSLPPSGERLLPLALSLGDGLPPALCRAVDGSRALILIDSALDATSLGELEPLAAHHELVFVRLRADEAFEVLRERLDAIVPWGGPALVLDASAWLDDEGASDLPRSVDAQRLGRLVARLRAHGARVEGLVTATECVLETDVTLFTPLTLAARIATHQPPPPVRESFAALTGAHLVGGNRVELEWNNTAARRALIDSAARAQHRIHVQSYMFEDDEIVAELTTALCDAAARGVTVRVVADALYSLHEAFGASNAVLSRLAHAGVEVRTYQPFSGTPSLADLKQRNHRKLFIFDGTLAWVSGRNLGANYYQGFDEVPLSCTSGYRVVPWLDVSARLEGPLVAQVERAFLRDWERAGGASFDVVTPPPVGDLTCRLVLHRGLGDTHTLDAQRALIDDARSRLVLVNTFPLVLELQRALMAAVARGVRVQVLFGNVRPRWGEDQPFEGGVLRALGDELVRSRFEPVLRAGGEGYEFALDPLPGWTAELRRVYPHVHAKLLVRDEADVAVGSANVDVTSAYWESEALLVVHDAALARTTLATVDRLLAGARRVDVARSDWSEQRGRREWLGRHWPTLLS